MVPRFLESIRSLAKVARCGGTWQNRGGLADQGAWLSRWLSVTLFVVHESVGRGPRLLGRYALYDKIGSGGMASVHLGRLRGPIGFSRTVAIKRMHAALSENPELVSMFFDEVRLAARIRHPNVVSTLDVIAESGELYLVMEYVPGESLSRLVRLARDRGEPIPHQNAATIVANVLHGLHAAHEARDEQGEPMCIVHRDVSPQNILVGTDGVARVLMLRLRRRESNGAPPHDA